MTFLTLQSTDIFNFYAIHFTGFDIVVELLVDTVKLVALGAVVIEVHVGLTVTVDTPSHAQVGHLFYFIHGSDLTVTALTLYITGADVLGVVKINVVGQIVDFHPFDWLRFSRIPFGRIVGIEAGELIQFGDLGCTIYCITVFFIQFGSFFVGVNRLDRKSVV